MSFSWVRTGHNLLLRDSAISEEDITDYPVESLKSIDIAGLPPHILNTKCRMRVMVLMNGTRCTLIESLMLWKCRFPAGTKPGFHLSHFNPQTPLCLSPFNVKTF